MTEPHEILKAHLTSFATLTEKDIADSISLWKPRKIKKGDFFNMQYMVCNDLGLVVKGIFRIYYCRPDTNEETNIFFFFRKSVYRFVPEFYYP